MAIQSPPNEQALLQRLVKGDERAFSQLFEAYYRQLGEYVFRLTESLELTEEIVQDVFITVWLKRSELGTINSFSNYLFIICRNRSFDALRKKAREQVHQQQLRHYLSTHSDEGNAFAEYASLIDAAVAKLPAQQHKVYTLSRYHRLKHEEIAERLGLAPETVKKHIQHAVRFITNELRSRIDTVIITILLTPMTL